MKIIWTTSPKLYHIKACTEEDNTYTAPWSKLLLLATGTSLCLWPSED